MTPRPASLDDLIARAGVGEQVLVVYGSYHDALVADLREFFHSLNVELDVRGDVPADEDAGSAVLYTDGDRRGTEDVADLVEYVAVGADGTFDGEAPALIREADTSVRAVENDGRRRLVRGSQVVEETAWMTGNGTFHAGLQRLSRLAQFERTRDVFERLVRAGVDVHVYAVPDADLDDPPYAVHPREDDETREHWFVTYESADGAERGALVCREAEPGRYTGFWSFDPEYVDPAVAYVEEAYANA